MSSGAYPRTVRKILFVFVPLAPLAAYACGNGLPVLTPQDASPPVDVAVEAPKDVISEPKPTCDTTKPFQPPVALLGTDLQTGLEYAPAFSADELTMWFTSGRPSPIDGAVASQVHIYKATRPSLAAPFGEPVFDDVLNGNSNDSDPFLSVDGLTMYFQSDRDLDPGDLFFATRPSASSDFGTPQAIASVNDPINDDTQPTIDGTGALWFASSRGGTGSLDIYRAAPGATFGTPAEEVELDSPDDDWSPTITADALTIYFASKRTGGQGNDDIWVAKRTSATLPFTAPQNVAELNTVAFELPHWLSADGCRLYLARSQAATYELYAATKPQ